jgi:hypothetical protein
VFEVVSKYKSPKSKLVVGAVALTLYLAEKSFTEPILVATVFTLAIEPATEFIFAEFEATEFILVELPATEFIFVLLELTALTFAILEATEATEACADKVKSKSRMRPVVIEHVHAQESQKAQL